MTTMTVAGLRVATVPAAMATAMAIASGALLAGNTTTIERATGRRLAVVPSTTTRRLAVATTTPTGATTRRPILMSTADPTTAPRRGTSRRVMPATLAREVIRESMIGRLATGNFTPLSLGVSSLTLMCRFTRRSIFPPGARLKDRHPPSQDPLDDTGRTSQQLDMPSRLTDFLCIRCCRLRCLYCSVNRFRGITVVFSAPFGDLWFPRRYVSGICRISGNEL